MFMTNCFLLWYILLLYFYSTEQLKPQHLAKKKLYFVVAAPNEELFWGYVWATTRQAWDLPTHFSLLYVSCAAGILTHSQIPSLVLTGVWLKIHMQILIYLKLHTSIEHHKGKDLLSNSKTIPLTDSLNDSQNQEAFKTNEKQTENGSKKLCWQTEHFEVSVFFLQKSPSFLSSIVRAPNLSLKVDTSSIVCSQKATSFQSDLFPSLT